MSRHQRHIVALAILFAIVGTMGPFSSAWAEAELKYSCSNQIYQAFDKEKIEAFSAATGIKVDVACSSSNSAVYRLMNNFSEIASTARSLYRGQQEQGYTQIPLCKDPLAVIAKAECGVDSLTEKQLQDIFSGRIKNWSQVGGVDMPIMVIVPGEDTAANKNFRRQVMKHEEIAYDFMTWDSTMAVKAVEYFPCGSVSFIARGAMAHLKDIKTLKINGVAPSDPDYPYYQEFFYITKGEPAGAARKFIEFSFSEEGMAIMKRNGMIPASPSKSSQ